ncbi:sirohydrochlorin cobaltochelatase [Megamonas hypermegale]|uniref:sirohydrochlorin cobaltochelatase n=1 Tax=Megamonas hypermegale TaxID=158847 RepID=UPI0025A47485|nr:sirohydrochlorin cobaltochelatase [Megamonas hypermegale]MDM8143717.1 sirohydrochlorin cobaltochelatase [Megamonas hypermegale]
MKSKWKKMLIASMACVALTSVSATSFAAYSLSTEVKTPTQALLQATEIGVRTYNTDNPELQKAPNKDAILIMSFGTTFPETRAKTIEATVKQIQAAHPDTKVVLAFTSHIIIDRVKANEGITIPTPEQALEQLKAEGYNRVALTSLDIIPGIEYKYKTAVFDVYKTQFKKMTIGTPLMYWMGQENQRDDVETTMKALGSQLPQLGKDDAVLIMAHGTPDPANAYYAVMQDRLNDLYNGKVLIYTVEGHPNLENVIAQLKADNVKNVTMMPFMMVAGDHATNDMAGDEEDSHKSILIKEGFNVKTYLHGLGENENIRQLFVDRADEAWNTLEAE